MNRGAYRYISHPNYAVTIVETFVLPLAFGAVALAVIMTALWWTVLDTKMKLENGALAPRVAPPKRPGVTLPTLWASERGAL